MVFALLAMIQGRRIDFARGQVSQESQMEDVGIRGSRPWTSLASVFLTFNPSEAFYRSQPSSSRRVPPLSMQDATAKKLFVVGGNGFVGREVCKYAVQAGFDVTSLSRRGQNPQPGDQYLDQVSWNAGNALDKETIEKFVNEADAVVHCIGLLFDAKSGLEGLNDFTSASGSKPEMEEEKYESTYDNITRKTMFLIIEALLAKANSPFNMFSSSGRTPIGFVSCAESGWPDVAFGPQVEEASPDWLKRYLVAKRAVEAKLDQSTDKLRPVIVRPSLIWNWQKLDVLPVIPIFNIANLVGVPFVDKTVRVEDVGRSLVQGLLDEDVSGVQRFSEMESLSAALPYPK